MPRFFPSTEEKRGYKGQPDYEHILYHAVHSRDFAHGDWHALCPSPSHPFGASEKALVFAYPYLMLYLIGTLPSMIPVGMNSFINAQGYSTMGMFSVAIGALANLLLDPLFIFAFGLGVCGAAIATVISQTLSAAFVLYFLTRRSELQVRLLKRKNFLSP